MAPSRWAAAVLLALTLSPAAAASACEPGEVLAPLRRGEPGPPQWENYTLDPGAGTVTLEMATWFDAADSTAYRRSLDQDEDGVVSAVEAVAPRAGAAEVRLKERRATAGGQPLQVVDETTSLDGVEGPVEQPAGIVQAWRLTAKAAGPLMDFRLQGAYSEAAGRRIAIAAPGAWRAEGFPACGGEGQVAFAVPDGVWTEAPWRGTVTLGVDAEPAAGFGPALLALALAGMAAASRRTQRSR